VDVKTGAQATALDQKRSQPSTENGETKGEEAQVCNNVDTGAGLLPGLIYVVGKWMSVPCKTLSVLCSQI
jgi:hypothetical protein